MTEPTPDVIEPIRAYRAWAVETTEDGTVLRGYAQTVWPRGVLLAGACMREATKHIPGCGNCPSPTKDDHEGYGCGIYAYKNADLLNGDRTQVSWYGYYCGRSVYGEVFLWGRVFEHASGYRAEYAEVAAIWDGGPNAADIAERYAVPLVTAPSLEEKHV